MLSSKDFKIQIYTFSSKSINVKSLIKMDYQQKSTWQEDELHLWYDTYEQKRPEHPNLHLRATIFKTWIKTKQLSEVFTKQYS